MTRAISSPHFSPPVPGSPAITLDLRLMMNNGGCVRIQKILLPRLPPRRASAYIKTIGETAMIDHTSLGVRDYEKAVKFYTAILAALGFTPQRINPDEAAFGTTDEWGFFLYPAAAEKSIVGERNHVAFKAGDKTQVVEFHRIASENGASQVRPPGPRPDIGPEYYGTVLTDLDGHTLEAVFWDRG